jgi:hypothetical protein
MPVALRQSSLVHVRARGLRDDAQPAADEHLTTPAPWERDQESRCQGGSVPLPHREPAQPLGPTATSPLCAPSTPMSALVACLVCNASATLATALNGTVGSSADVADLYGITRTARSTRRRMTTAWSPTQSRRRDCPSRLKADTSEPTSSMLLMRGSTRPPACSVGLEPLPSKRTDCRSAAGGGVHADARVATELERQESRGLTRQRLPLCPDDAALRRRPRAGSAPPLARFTPAASRRAAVSAPSTRLPVLVQGSDASNATKLLARSPGSRLPASAVTTAPPRGCRTNHTGCTNLTMVDFADLVREAQARRAGPPRRK